MKNNFEIPDSETIDSLFSSVLELLLYPPSLKEQMIATESVERKWEMIKVHKQIFEKDSEIKLSREDNISKILQSFKRGRFPDIKKILSLKSILCVDPTVKIKEFLQNDGLHILFSFLNNDLIRAFTSELDAAVIYEVLSSIKIVMNSKVGMDSVLEINDSFDSIAYCLKFEWKALSTLVTFYSLPF